MSTKKTDEGSMNESRPRADRITQGHRELQQMQAEGFGVMRVHRHKYLVDAGMDPMEPLLMQGYEVKKYPFGHDGVVDMICPPEVNRQNIAEATARAEGQASATQSPAIQSVRVETETITGQDIEEMNG